MDTANEVTLSSLAQCVPVCHLRKMFEWSREHVIRLVDFYRELPALWNVRHKDHKNKHFLQLGYEQLELKMQETIPEITCDQIKKKIHTLHNQLNREYKLFRESNRSGAGVDDVYKPKLWCFDILKFIKENDNDIRQSRSTLDNIQVEVTDDADTEENLVIESNNVDMNELERPSSSSAGNIEPCPTISVEAELDLSQINADTEIVTSKRKEHSYPVGVAPPSKKRSQIQARNAGLQLVEAAVTQLNRFPSTSRTNAQIFGEFVGSELSTMEEAQYKIAKKIIIDVLLKGNDNILQPDMQLYTV